MEGSEPATMLKQSAQDRAAIGAHANSAACTMGARHISSLDKSLIARCFTSFGPSANALANPRDFLVFPGACFSPSDMNFASGNGPYHGSDGSLWPAEGYCKTGVTPGNEGRFGKRTPEVGPCALRNPRAFLFSTRFAGRRQKGKTRTDLVFSSNGLLWATNPPSQSQQPTHAAGDARRGERRNEA